MEIKIEESDSVSWLLCHRDKIMNRMYVNKLEIFLILHDIHGHELSEFTSIKDSNSIT